MPSLGGATEWVKSDPLGAAGLRGHVVLVNFWTLDVHQLAARRSRTCAHGRRPIATTLYRRRRTSCRRTQQAHGEDGREAIEGRGRRWYQLRPEPRRRTDLMGFNSTWWMAVGWLIVIVLLVFPFPWWW